jgi:hypothetical protein
LYAGGKKRTIKQLFVNIRNKVHDWRMSFESRHLWTARLFVYGFLLLLVILVGTILFTHFNLFHTDVNSARYMLSALVQSQAAIVAIVITLTLIAVQLTASAYSPRVIDIFKKNPDMWLLLGCYGFSIFYGFIVLKLVEGEFVSQSAIWSFGCVSISFESYVSLAYWLGAFTFVALFPYMLNIISLLKPESVIKRLAVEITKAKILNSKEDPIQPIVDIIHGSIMKYDSETTRVGLKTATDQVIEIMKIMGTDDEIDISRHFCNHLKRVGRLAISKEDEGSTIEVIENFGNFAKSTAEKRLDGATLEAADSLGEVGRIAANKSLGIEAFRVAESLGEVGEAAAEKGLVGATFMAVLSLTLVGKVAMEKGFEGVTLQTAESLGAVGKAAAEKGFLFLHVTVQAVVSLDDFGEAAAEKGFEDVDWQVACSLGAIGRAATEKGLEETTQKAAYSLGKVGRTAVERGFLGAALQAADFLGVIGKAAAEKLGWVTLLRIVWSLEDIGKAAAEKGFEPATEKAAESLAKLTLLSERIVKMAIQDYESELKEKERVALQKFMKIYEKELDKRRAEKRTQNEKT